MSCSRIHVAVLLGVGVALCEVAAQAQVEVDLPAAAATSIFSQFPDNDFGATTLVAGTNSNYNPARALFSFDLSSIPAGATITQVTFGMTETRHPDPDQHGGPVSSNFDLYPLYVPWGQGSGAGNDGGPAGTGDATWNANQYGVSTWSAPGGQAGIDFGSNAVSTTFVSGLGYYEWGSTNDFVTTVQGWLDDPSTNFGLIMISEQEGTPGTGRRFGSIASPGGSVAPPTLIVDYTATPEPMVLGLLLPGLVSVGFVRQRPRVRRS
jgi:hypothetical protein